MRTWFNRRGWVTAGLMAAVAFGWQGQGAVLKHSDVVFMYDADSETYAAYQATVLAWGGKPEPNSPARAQGARVFGSVGMVTEFDRYHDRFPQTYEQGLCRDLAGKPVKVPWLTDHQHQGVPYWWCCTQQPQFRQYLRERVVETMRAGADGLHVDDHLGTAGGLWDGLCFCDRCLAGFRAYLQSLPAAERRQLGINQPARFDFGQALRPWITVESTPKRAASQHPLWPHWIAYQCRAAAAFMRELRDLAAATAGHPVPVGANAGLLWPRHLSDYQVLDLFTAETDHQASMRKPSDLPLVAYRLAEAVNRPYAATASGGDWAFIKEQNLPGLVCTWIALSHAAGHHFMAPHRQWCYTPQKGTHWYEGPTEKFSPLYRFVREQAVWFDRYETFAEVAVVLPHRSYVKQPGRWFDLCNQLAAANLNYTIVLAGDEIVDHALSARRLASARALLAPERHQFMPADRRVFERQVQRSRVFATVEEVVAALRPAVQVQADGRVRALARVKGGRAVIHLLNYDYQPASDTVRPLRSVRVTVDPQALGVPDPKTCRLITPEAPPLALPLREGQVEVLDLGLWALLVLEAKR